MITNKEIAELKREIETCAVYLDEHSGEVGVSDRLNEALDRLVVLEDREKQRRWIPFGNEEYMATRGIILVEDENYQAFGYIGKSETLYPVPIKYLGNDMWRELGCENEYSAENLFTIYGVTAIRPLPTDFPEENNEN